jgi:hypothetical protein
MLDEANKDEKQDQAGAPQAPAEAPQPTPADNDGSLLPAGAFAGGDQQQQHGTGYDGARTQDGEHQNKDEKQEQAGVPQAPAEAPQPTPAHNNGSPLPNGGFPGEDQQTQHAAGCDHRTQDGEHQTDPAGAVDCDSPGSTPHAQGEDKMLSGPGQTEQKPVSADGTDTAKDEVTPEIEDLFTVTNESEEDKRTFARVMASYDEYLGRGNIREPGDGPDIPDLEFDSAEPECDDYKPPQTLGLIRREGRIHIAEIEWRGLRPKLTVVSDPDSPPYMPAVYSKIRLPNHVAEYQSARGVFDAVYGVLQNCSALSRQQCELLTFWSIATWFQDSLDCLPRITITGPRYAAHELLTLLSYVCLKAIPLVGMSSALLKQIEIGHLCSTLLIHQVKPSKTATELLDATDYPGYNFVIAGELREVCCAKAVYIGETYNPKQSISGLHIHLGRNAPVPTAPYPTASGVESLQNQLFSYFAFNRERIKFLKVSPGQLQPEFDVIARRRGAVIINDSALQRRLVELLKGWSEDLRAERAGGIEGTVLTAVLNLSHENEAQAYAQEIAVATNQIRIAQGEPSKLTPEKVGHVLRKLGLHTRRDMNGRRLVFDKSTQVLVHELCLEYDVLPAAPECGYCHKLQTPESE